ncbi:MAG: protoporphyrinogen oxidase [Candidatus Kapaibacterium sp.]
MEKTINTAVLIIGAGISGLSSAHFLNKLGISCEIIEKTSQPGGSVRSNRIDGFLAEQGPNSALETTPLLSEVFKDAGIIDQMVYANPDAKKRYILKNGELEPLPNGLPAFLRTKLFSPAAKFRLTKEPFIKKRDAGVDESLADFVVRRLGREFLDYAVNPFVAGIFAGTPEKLSTKYAFPKLYQLEQEYGSLIIGSILGAKKRKQASEKSKQSARMFSFINGLDTFPKALAGMFANHLHYNCDVISIRRVQDKWELIAADKHNKYTFIARSLLLTVPAHTLRIIPLPEGMPPIDREIYYPPVAVAFFGYRDNPAGMPLDGFGFLVPEKEKKNILGTIWSSALFPNRAPEGGTAFTTFIGGSRQPVNALKSDDEIADMAYKDLVSIMGINRPPDVRAIFKWRTAIPQYELGYGNILREIEQYECKNPGLFISGNFRGGISVADCVKQASIMSARMKEYLH